jgi:hypothetical protein
MCLARFESLIPILSIAIWSELFRIPSYHFGRKNDGHRRREEKYQGMDAWERRKEEQSCSGVEEGSRIKKQSEAN